MGRPKGTNPSDFTLRVRTHRSVHERLERVAIENHRTVGKEALVAIINHLEEEEQRLGIASDRRTNEENTLGKIHPLPLAAEEPGK